MKKLRGMFFYTMFYLSCIPISRRVKRIAEQDEIRKLEALQKITQPWIKWATNMVGIEIDLNGLENIPSEPCIYMFNHRSTLDVLVTGAFLPTPTKTIAKVSIKHKPFFGTIVTSTSIFVDRENKTSRGRALVTATHALRKGISIIVYPEGTRNTLSVPLLEFAGGDGFFGVSFDQKIPIVVGIIRNSGDIMPSEGGCVTPGKVIVELLPPIKTHEKYVSSEEAKRSIHQLMVDKIINK